MRTPEIMPEIIAHGLSSTLSPYFFTVRNLLKYRCQNLNCELILSNWVFTFLSLFPYSKGNKRLDRVCVYLYHAIVLPEGIYQR